MSYESGVASAASHILYHLSLCGSLFWLAYGILFLEIYPRASNIYQHQLKTVHLQKVLCFEMVTITGCGLLIGSLEIKKKELKQSHYP